MTIEITSCQDCPFGNNYAHCQYPNHHILIWQDDIKVPVECPLRQDNKITFKLKEDDKI